MDLPRYLQIEPVGQCNLQCQMCAARLRTDCPADGPAFMSFPLFARLLDQFHSLAELHLQGLGEPLLHPRFCDMVDYAAARGVRVSTSSNLSRLPERVAGRLAAGGLTLLHVSVDGATARTYERIRVGGRWDRVTANIERLLSARARAGTGLPRLHVTFVAMRDNLSELPALVKLAAGWGAEQVFVQRLCHDFDEGTLPEQYREMHGFISGQMLDSADPGWVAGLFEQARAAASASGIDVRLPRIAPAESPAPCDWPWRGAYISYQGYAMPCCMISTPDRCNLGNPGVEGVEAVWNGEAYAAFRAALASDRPPDICRACALYRGLF